MTTDYRALCAELLADYEEHLCRSVLAARARAALAEPDGPAVPESREPASVTGEPTDRELLELMPQQLREDMATVSRMAAHGAGTGVRPGLFRVSLNTGAVDYARAVLARWGRPAPVPAEGEVAWLIEFLRNFGDELMNEHGGVAEHNLLASAADLLEQHNPAPVPVSERLPGPEDCDGEGRCWWGFEETDDYEASWTLRKMIGLPFDDTHWLPAHALPLPSGEVEP